MGWGGIGRGRRSSSALCGCSCCVESCPSGLSESCPSGWPGELKRGVTVGLFGPGGDMTWRDVAKRRVMASARGSEKRILAAFVF